MIGIVLFTHAHLGQGLVEAVELIAGKQENVAAVGLVHGDGVERFEERCRAAIEAVNEGDGVLALVDFCGGTPANTALRCMREKAFPCVAGVNMPMLLEAATSRDQNLTPQELADLCMDVGTSGIVRMEVLMEKLADSENGDEF